jgi:hypothetical protein
MMKECFGLRYGGLLSEEMVFDEDQRAECLLCQDAEMCQQVCMVRNMQQNRAEMRRGVRNLRYSMGGSHSEFPFG